MFLHFTLQKQIHLFLASFRKLLLAYMLLHSVFDKIKTRNIIMKTQQTSIAYAHWNRWTSYDMIKHNMISTDIILM